MTISAYHDANQELKKQLLIITSNGLLSHDLTSHKLLELSRSQLSLNNLAINPHASNPKLGSNVPGGSRANSNINLNIEVPQPKQLECWTESEQLTEKTDGIICINEMMADSYRYMAVTESGGLLLRV